MNRLPSLILVAFLGLTATISTAQEKTSGRPNLLINGSFEKGMDGWTFKPFKPGGNATIDTTEMRDGRQTLRIDNPAGNDSFVTQKVTVKPNTRYRMTGYIKTKDVVPDDRKSKAGAILSLSGGFESTDPIQKTKPWAKVSFDFESGGRTEVVVGPRIGQYSSLVAGTAWFADLELEEIGRSRK